jgi:hypothetical protein
MAAWEIGFDCSGPRMITPSEELEGLKAELARVSDLLVLTNDAALGLSGILGRVIVEAGLVGRSDLADAIEHHAGPTEAANHNPLLLAFARAVRMNFPGGRST